MSAPSNKMPNPRVHIRTSVRLTRTESQVLTSIADGQGRKSIGKAMRVDRQQLNYHLSQAYLKLKVTNIAAAITVAKGLGIIPLEPAEASMR